MFFYYGLADRINGIDMKSTSLFIITCFGAFLILNSSSKAQTVIGRTFDLTSKEPVGDVIIFLKPSKEKISAIQSTGADGIFTLPQVRLKDFILETKRIGYHDKVIEHLFIPSGDTLEIEIGLLPSSVVLGEVTVTGERRDMELDAIGFYKRKLESPGRFYSVEELKPMGKNSMRDFLTNIPGITYVHNDNEFYFKRSETFNQPIMFYLDGILINQDFTAPPSRSILGGKKINPAEKAPNPVELINPHTIKAIEVYENSIYAPYQFSKGKTGGVVLIWTGN